MTVNERRPNRNAAEAESDKLLGGNTTVPLTDHARLTTIYRVTSTRTTNGTLETVTVLRRQWPAAVRLADAWRALGREPVNIDAVAVPAEKWVRLG